jgi:hypothetical protein
MGGGSEKTLGQGANVLVHFKTVGMRISTITKLKIFQPFAFIYFVLYIIFTITS